MSWLYRLYCGICRILAISHEEDEREREKQQERSIRIYLPIYLCVCVCVKSVSLSLCPILSYLFLSYLILSCAVWSHLILCCLITSDLSCFILSYRVISYIYISYMLYPIHPSIHPSIWDVKAVNRCNLAKATKLDQILRVPHEAGTFRRIRNSSKFSGRGPECMPSYLHGGGAHNSGNSKLRWFSVIFRWFVKGRERKGMEWNGVANQLMPL